MLNRHCDSLIIILALSQLFTSPPLVLPVAATAALRASLSAAAAHPTHVWRDTVPVNADGTINAFIEIPRGERRKYELDIARNERRVDRVMPESVGAYPVNDGFVPQTISYDGDPFDALVLGPALRGGELVRGAIVGIMHMEDEKGLDSKVVLSLTGPDGRRTHTLSDVEEQRIGDYFDRYKRHEPGKFSRVTSWGSRETALAFVRITQRFFRECRVGPRADCTIVP